MIKNNDSLIRKIYNYLVNHWFIASVIGILPLLFEFFLNIEIKNNNYSIFFYVEIAMIFLIFIASLFKNYGNNVDVKKRGAATYYYNKMIDVMNQNVYEKMESLLEIIDNREYEYVKSKKSKQSRVFEPYDNISSRLNPCKQIKIYCNNVINILMDTFGVKKDEIVITLFFMNVIDNYSNWEVLYSTYNTNDISIKELMNDPNSSFGQVKDKPTKLFFESKKKACREFHYTPSETEAQMGFENLTGTIYCHNISIIENGKVQIPIVFSISSIGTDLCSDDDFLAKKRAQKLFEIIELQIQYEMTRMIFYKQTGLSQTFGGIKKQK